MAAPFQVNINITSGTSFSQEFTVTNNDMSPTNMTGFEFFAKVAKHPEAINAATSTSDAPVWKYLPMTTAIVNGTGGVYSISLSSADSDKLNEGKYVYSVVMRDNGGEYSELVSGLAFVDKAFGYTPTGTVDPNF